MSQYLGGGLMGEHQITGIGWGQFTELPAILSTICSLNMRNMIAFSGASTRRSRLAWDSISHVLQVCIYVYTYIMLSLV